MALYAVVVLFVSAIVGARVREGRWLLRKSHYRVLTSILIAVGAFLLLQVMGELISKIPAGAEFLERFGRAAIWGFVVALLGGLLIKYVKNEQLWTGIDRSELNLGKVGRPALLLILLMLVALVTFGGYAYPQLPKSWGGGSPVFVEFVIDEEAKPMLEALGLEVGDNNLTERVEFLAASEERIFIATQQGDTLSFDPNLVKASKFYNVDYYTSAALHMSSGDWYRQHLLWQDAIKAYNAALLIEADLTEAKLGRGTAYAEVYFKSISKSPDNADEQAYGLSGDDLNDAIKEAEETLNGKTWRLAMYQLARLEYARGEDKLGALDNLEQAIKGHLDLQIEGDSSLRQVAMIDEVFQKDILGEDKEAEELRGTLSLGEDELASEYAGLAQRAAEQGQDDEAIELYDLAVKIMETFVENEKDGEKSNTAAFLALKGEFLESVGLIDEAIEAYLQAKEYASGVNRYADRLAHLMSEKGLTDEAFSQCSEPQEGETTTDGEDSTSIRCKIVRGNTFRDKVDQDLSGEAQKEYELAVTQAISSGVPSLAAEAYYEFARLEARRENTSKAIEYLEMSVWLNHGLAADAEKEVDFDPLRESSDFHKAVFPPIIDDVQSNSNDGAVTFRLQETFDDFPFRVNILARILNRQDFQDIYNDTNTGLARSFEASEDLIHYTFELFEPADAAELARDIRRLLGLTEQVAQPVEETS
jgi:tetratricopeptide (TPR) repeat protein